MTRLGAPHADSFVKGALAAKEVGAGMEACQACRRVLEGMHHDWHDLLSRLLAAKALSIESAWQVLACHSKLACPQPCLAPMPLSLHSRTRKSTRPVSTRGAATESRGGLFGEA